MTNFFETLGVHESTVIASDEVIDPTVDSVNGNGVYGYQEKGYPRPESLAPPQEANGGFLFLPNDVPGEFTDTLVALTGLAGSAQRPRTQYAVQAIDAPSGMEQELGYLRKLVIADRFALRYMYGSIAEHEYSTYPEQPLTVAELVRAFMKEEREKYGTGFGGFALSGKFGGDGEYAQEELSFGYAIENSYFGVASVWSRAWLVTK